MPHANNTNNCGVVVFKEPAMHQTPANHHTPKRLAAPTRLLLGLMMLLAWTATAQPAPAQAAAADTCPNAELRALNNSTRLPDCRAYEMVTSPYKQGFDAREQTYSDDGALAYWSVGNFAGNTYGSLGNQYVTRRSETGWKSISMNPPGEQWVFLDGEGARAGLSNDLRSSLWWMRSRSGPDERWTEHSDQGALYLRRPDGVFSLIAPNPGTDVPRVYASTPDLVSHVVVGGELGYPAPNLYDVSDGDQVLHPIAIDNTGAAFPVPADLLLCPQGISDDGRVIFFGIGIRWPDACSGPLRARVGGKTTIEMSASQCTRSAGDLGGACNADAPVIPVYPGGGFARDGSRAFFTTTQQLVNGDTDATNDLYACDIPVGTLAPVIPVNVCPNLRQVSASAAGGGDVESVVRVADDGSRVYFVARGVLAANHGANDQTAVAGAHNLYVWETDAEHPEGHTTFMARLLVIEDGITGETTPDGRYLVVTTTTPLVSSGAAADADSATDVYRYDAVTGEWLRLSTGTTGSGGNAEIDAVSRIRVGKGNIRERASMTDDGHTVVFETGEALAPADANRSADVYAWHEGQVSLISADGGNRPRITASGTDIFFSTEDQVTAADGDTSADVYDARVGGGFDLRAQGPCEGEGCLGAPPTPPGLPGGAGGQGELGDVQESAPRFTLRAISAAQRRALAQSGRVTVTVISSKPGSVSARVSTTIGGKSSSGAVVRESMAEAGSVQLSLTLSKKARARLVAKRRLSVSIVVSHSKFALPRSATLRLTLAAKANRKAAKKVAERSSVGRVSDDRGGRS
jgi:hypothetical protein